MNTINKELLKKYRFSDHPNAWIIGAKGFYHSAKIQLKAISTQQMSKLVSLEDATLNLLNIKTVCFLFSISIELFLKGIYSAVRTSDDMENTESFNHDTIKLVQKLVSRGMVKKNELDAEVLKIAKITLEWSGRYHKPKSDIVDKVIAENFEEVPDQPEMVKAKFTLNHETAIKLQQIAKRLSDIAPTNPASIDNLLFMPF